MLYAVAGASRSGKTVWTAQQVDKEKRLLVWDFKGEWALRYRCAPVGSFRELADAVKPGAPARRLAFHQVSGMGEPECFDRFCRLAWVWVRAGAGSLVVEETASVTSPGKAPRAWGDIIRMGLGFGCTIYALTQRPAESDKTALGNATVVHCGRMGTLADRKTMAGYLDVDVAEVTALKPLEWIERTDVGEVRRGVVRFKNLRK